MTGARRAGRPRVGSVYEKHGVRQLAVTTDRPGAKRARWVKPCPLASDGSVLTDPEARALAAKLQREYDAGRWDPWAPASEASAPAPAKPLETTSAWCARWCEAREAAGLRSVKDDRARLRLHVLPLLGEVPIAQVTRAQLEDVRDALDAKARAGELSPSTALKAWGVVTKMFSDARASKTRALRVRDDNPALDIEPPDRGNDRASAYLYPSEFAALVGCERVPLRWRRLFALAAYTGLRAGEIEALAWADVDLERGILHVHRSVDRETGELTATKTKLTRRFALERGLLPMLRAMHREAGGAGRVVPTMPPREDGAVYLRTCLGYAGVTRAELFARTTTQRPIDFHDLRATFLTWCAVRGDEPLRIMQRAGHTTFATTQRYVRAAENLRGADFGELFPALPALATAVPAGSSATASATEIDEAPGTLTIPGASLRPQRDLNPCQTSPSDACGAETQGKHHAGEGGVGRLRTAAGGLATDSATEVAALGPPVLDARCVVPGGAPAVAEYLAQTEASALAVLRVFDEGRGQRLSQG